MEVSNWTWIALQLWLLLLVGVAAYAEGRLREAMQKHALPVVHPPIGSTDWGGGGGGVATRGSLSAECTVSNATSPKKEVEKESDRAQVVAMVGGLMQDSAGLDMDARGLKEEDLYDSMDRVDDVLAIRRLGSLDCGVVPRAQSCVASLSPVARVYSWHGPVEGARTAERDVLPRQVTAPVARVRKDVAVAADVIDAIVREAVERMLKRVGEDEIEMLTRTVQGAAQARNSYERVASVVDKYRRDVASSVLSEDNSNLREVKEEVEIVTAESGAIGGMAGVVEVEPGLEVHSLYGLMSEASQSTLASPVRSL
ncbi:hypothetical protein BC830DRAFT_673943 [Chytriomyces sp. MP71]|nr:hypothetical protein BC830DRAFT_673943 [Chytriomyces sp. MP71]